MTAETFRTLFIIVCLAVIIIGLTRDIVIPIVKAVFAAPEIVLVLGFAALIGFVMFVWVPA